MEPVIQLNDRVHGAAQESTDFFFPLSDLGFRSHPLQFRCRARGEDLKHRVDAWLLGNRPPVDHRHMAENLPVRVL
jgi:hypothetical protein